MSQPRSPGYPSIALPEAIEIVSKLHDQNRTNPIEREAAAKDIGYSGLTGTSAKVLSDLNHFGLVEKAGKGGLRVSQVAVDILYPDTPATKLAALQTAAASPSLFAALGIHFSDGAPSLNSLRAYLMRNGFASVAIPPIVKSYTETMRFVQQEGASESHGEPDRDAAPSLRGEPTPIGAKTHPVATLAPQPTPSARQPQEVPILSGERVIYVDEIDQGRYLKVVASGEMDETLLDALEDFVKRRKKRLLLADRPDENDPGVAN